MLQVHRAASGDVLARGLADVLADPPADADPFAPEVVAVPAKGVERWLAQRLSHVLGDGGTGDGVCAGVRFPWPSTLVDEAVGSASEQHAASVELWAPGRATWALLDVVDASLDEPWCRSLARYLQAGGGQTGRRYAVAARLAGRFESYGRSRPQMLRAWADGRDEDGSGAPLDDLRWQAELWRRLRNRLAVPAPAELVDAACERLRAEPGRSELPSRLSVFGASRLSPSQLDVLAALACHRDVHLWLHHPSPALWDAVAAAPTVRRRADDTTSSRLRNPLLASMARDLTELQQLVRRCAREATDVLHPSPPPPSTLLGRLRDDLALDRALPLGSAQLPELAPGDRSIQVHACHGRTRQVEVLREVVLGLLADDPTLEPRDVLVMCPDVEAFAPLVAAAFSLGAEDGSEHPAARLRVRLADRALRQTNALLDVLSRLLELGGARCTASQVLDLAGRSAVRRRFDFDDDQLERLRGWVVTAGVRWGLDAPHRAGWQLAGFQQGTWRAGLDRLLLGVAVQGDDVGPGDVVPIDDVDSADIDLLGRFAELVDRLDAAHDLLAGRRTAAAWAQGLLEAVLRLAAAAPQESWQQAQLAGELADLAEAAHGSEALVGLADVREALSAVLAGRPTRASFRTGTLTVCTLVPMRSVPHRVVCLLGLDDGAFPRQGSRDGDDVLGRDPWVGERDARSEDRQLLLDAVGAAQDHLVVVYSGADDRTGATVVPSVPLGELLDAVDRTARTPQGRVRDAITTRHPLQPFDRRNFVPAELGPNGPFSFDPRALAGAVAGEGARSEPGPFLAAPLADTSPTVVALSDLKRLLQHPARGFLRQRLSAGTAWADEEPVDALPVELDSLQQWDVGERVLRQRLSGASPAHIIDVEAHRGLLPPGELGAATLREIGGMAEAVAAACATERQLPATTVDVDADLGDGSAVTGTVGGVHGDVVLSTTYSNLGAKHRLEAWLDLLTLTAAVPDREWRAVAVGRRSGGAFRSVLGPVTADEARVALRELVEVYRAGLRSPLPLPLKASSEYAARRQQGADVTDARFAADQKWTSSRFPGEQDDAEHELLHGRSAPLQTVLAERPWAHETGPGWAADETDRFGALSRRVWRRLLAAESQGRS